MAIPDDFSIDRATGNIRYTGTTANYTVLAFYEWIRSLGDDSLAIGNDQYDITDDDIIEKQFDTIVTLLGSTNIDAATAEHLYNGSIIQGSGGTERIYDGIKIVAPAGTYVYLVQNNVILTNFWTTGLNADPLNKVSHQFMVMVRDAGADIDGRRILGVSREFGDRYNEFQIQGTERGVNTLPLEIEPDLNNETPIGTIAALGDISWLEGYQSIDVDDNGTPENYYGVFDRGANSINTFYERMKWEVRRGSVQTIFGLPGEKFRGITHEFDVDGQGVTDFVEPELITWPTGSAQLLACDDVNAVSKMWVQLLTGVIPGDGDVITGAGGATCNLNITVTERPISKPFCGQSTGTAIVGAFGFTLEATDLSSADKVTDLAGNPVAPPNNQNGFVTNLIAGDQVLVGPKDVGDAFEYDQFTLAAALTGGEASIQVNTTIPLDTPKPGTIRVFDGTNRVRVTYTGYTGDTFTGCVGAPAASISAPTFISYADLTAVGTSASFGARFIAPRDMYCQVRRGGASPIKTFKSAAVFSSSGFSLNTIRNPD